MKAVMYNYNCWIDYVDEKMLGEKLEKMLVESGFNIISKTEHYFPIQGYTCLWLLSESHLAVHSFPEENKIYIEITSCVKKYFDTFVEKINKMVRK